MFMSEMWLDHSCQNQTEKAYSIHVQLVYWLIAEAKNPSHLSRQWWNNHHR